MMLMSLRRAAIALLTICGFGLTMLNISCGSNNINSNSLTEDESDSALAGLDNASTSPSTPLSSIILADGTNVQSVLDQYGVSPPVVGVGINAVARPLKAPPSSPNDHVRLAIAQMLAEAELLSSRPNWQYPNEGANAPAQNGLAYVYGSKQFHSRTAAGCCPQLHGLDCSGLMSLVAQEAGLSVLDGTVNQNKPSAWTIPTSWGVQMTSIPITSTLQSGDIVYWNDAQTKYSGHIGIVDNGDIVQANGVYVATCDSNGMSSCAKNYSTHRGPNKWSIATTTNFFGNPSVILRLLPSGYTYSYIGANFGYNDLSATLGTHLTASVTFNKPLLPNMTITSISSSCPTLPACFYTSSGQDFTFSITNVEISNGSTVISTPLNCDVACVFTMMTDATGKISSAFLSGGTNPNTSGGSLYLFNIGGSPSTNYGCDVVSNGKIVSSPRGPDSVTYSPAWAPGFPDTYCAVAYSNGTWSGPI